LSGNRRHIVRNASNLETGESGDAANLDTDESSDDIVSALEGDTAPDAGVLGVDNAAVDGIGGLGGSPAAAGGGVKSATHASDGDALAVNPAGEGVAAITTSDDDFAVGISDGDACTADSVSNAGLAVAGVPAGGAAAVAEEIGFEPTGVEVVCILCTCFTLTTFIRFSRRTGASIGTKTGGKVSGFDVEPVASTELLPIVVLVAKLAACTALSLVPGLGLGLKIEKTLMGGKEKGWT